MTETFFAESLSTLRSTVSPHVEDVLERKADMVADVADDAMVHAVVPCWAFSSGTVGQVLGHGAPGAAMGVFGIGSMTAGGAIIGRRPEPLARTVPSLARATIGRMMRPP